MYDYKQKSVFPTGGLQIFIPQKQSGKGKSEVRLMLHNCITNSDSVLNYHNVVN